MSTRQEILDQIRQEAIIGVVREENEADAEALATAYADGGLRIIEITFTTPHALALITRLVDLYSPIGVTIAAGTVRSAEDAAEALNAGAGVLVSPHTDQGVISYALDHDVVCIAGASTPTEIIHAWEAGASIVKVYPARHLGGPDYIRTIRQPIRNITMLAGGPVEIDEIDAYLSSGAVAVNMGGAFTAPDLVRSKNWEEIARRIAAARGVVESRVPDTISL
ncbi:MAG TPA: bifunctional 4-hydroxy-2-oxoglutarate aldolase/2-dehydro-3-deoxy-phosphogluconate aldolase [Thermoanaerobaculia bacterium]|nr:bifunctional 4-hydroxy-2-oxoglutarate aldolase/2-dehydro-3-deoxy-phosphogluconate aldolase [Thermoanaerobaculia bacterium]